MEIQSVGDLTTTGGMLDQITLDVLSTNRLRVV